jgi:hypothetical protein
MPYTTTSEDKIPRHKNAWAITPASTPFGQYHVLRHNVGMQNSAPQERLGYHPSVDPIWTIPCPAPQRRNAKFRTTRTPGLSPQRRPHLDNTMSCTTTSEYKIPHHKNAWAITPASTLFGQYHAQHQNVGIPNSTPKELRGYFPRVCPPRLRTACEIWTMISLSQSRKFGHKVQKHNVGMQKSHAKTTSGHSAQRLTCRGLVPLAGLYIHFVMKIPPQKT